jgi:ESCRT-I complex subunit VPS37
VFFVWTVAMDVLNWFNRAPKSNLPEPTALQLLRARQIQQLRTINCRIIELQRDVEYKVIVDENSGLTLDITLPPQFPQDRPLVKVLPPGTHPWINEHSVVVGCPGINNFMVQSDLGRVIRELVDEFRCNPPLFTTADSYNFGLPSLSSCSPNTYPHNSDPLIKMARSSPLTTDICRSYPNSTPADVLGIARNTTINDACIPEFSKLSMGEINEIRENDDRLMQISNNYVQPHIDLLSAERLKFSEQLELFAKQNLEKKHLLEEKKRIVLEKYDHLNNLKSQFDENSRLQDDMLKSFDSQVLQDNLKVAALEAEEKSESIAEEFLEGKIPVEEFTKSFMQHRTLSHLRRAKEEKCSLTSFHTGNWKY